MTICSPKTLGEAAARSALELHAFRLPGCGVWVVSSDAFNDEASMEAWFAENPHIRKFVDGWRKTRAEVLETDETSLTEALREIAEHPKFRL
jgi:hypothetical protein